MTSYRKKAKIWAWMLTFSLSILLLSTSADASLQKFNFTMQNNSALNFENGSYIIEVIEIARPVYAKVNLTSNGQSTLRNLYDSEAPITFGQLQLSSSLITESSAMITIEFPDGWSYPKKYEIVRPVAAVGIPNIILTKSVDRSNLNIGDVAEFKIIAENTGNATAYNISLTEPLPKGFSSALGSRFPPAITDKLDAGERQELYYVLKAVESGTFIIEPTTIKYSSKTNTSNSLTIIVAEPAQKKPNLTTVISLNKNNVTVDDTFTGTVKITNDGTATAKSVLIEVAPQIGIEVTDGDTIKRYESIEPFDSKEYRITFKANEEGKYSIRLRTDYNDAPISQYSDSETITVTQKEKNYLFVFIPAIIIIAGIVLFTIRRHREYSY